MDYPKNIKSTIVATTKLDSETKKLSGSLKELSAEKQRAT